MKPLLKIIYLLNKILNYHIYINIYFKYPFLSIPFYLSILFLKKIAYLYLNLGLFKLRGENYEYG